MQDRSYVTPRHPTAACRNICQKFHARKKRNKSIYEENARCHNCETFIPRTELLDKDTEGVKARCPCCNKTWLKGVHVGMGMKRLAEAVKRRRLAQGGKSNNVFCR